MGRRAVERHQAKDQRCGDEAHPQALEAQDVVGPDQTEGMGADCGSPPGRSQPRQTGHAGRGTKHARRRRDAWARPAVARPLPDAYQTRTKRVPGAFGHHRPCRGPGPCPVAKRWRRRLGWPPCRPMKPPSTLSWVWRLQRWCRHKRLPPSRNCRALPVAPGGAAGSQGPRACWPATRWTKPRFGTGAGSRRTTAGPAPS